STPRPSPPLANGWLRRIGPRSCASARRWSSRPSARSTRTAAAPTRRSGSSKRAVFESAVLEGGILEGAALENAGSADPVHPAVGIGGATVLQVEEGRAQTRSDRSRLSVADLPALGLRLHLTDRRDHRRGAAGEDLRHGAAGDVRAPLIHRERALLDGVAEVLGQLEEAVSGHPGEQSARELRRDEARGSRGRRVHEEEVHAAHLLDVATLLRIEPDHLVTALGVRLPLSDEARRVVSGTLRLARAPRRGA